MEEQLLVVIGNRVFTVSKEPAEERDAFHSTAEHIAQRLPLSLSIVQHSNIVIDTSTNNPLKFRYDPKFYTKEMIEVLWCIALPVTIDELKEHIKEIYPEQKHNPWL